MLRKSFWADRLPEVARGLVSRGYHNVNAEFRRRNSCTRLVVRTDISREDDGRIARSLVVIGRQWRSSWDFEPRCVRQSLGDFHGLSLGSAGSATRTLSPPPFRAPRVISPPCSQTIERVTERPRPTPPVLGVPSAADSVEWLEHLLPLARAGFQGLHLLW